jgi:hypothetical protein
MATCDPNNLMAAFDQEGCDNSEIKGDEDLETIQGLMSR